jgi:protocatechuate 3,4-dioxygenase beta subunit
MIRATMTLLCLLALTTQTLAQQRDNRPATPTTTVPPAPTGTAVISGQVVADHNGAALPMATVAVLGATTGVVRVTTTDATGHFSVGTLPPDRYTVGASRAPFLGAVAGARRVARPGTPIVVPAGATVRDVQVRLFMGGSLSGRVLDAAGEPVRNATVSVYQRRMQNGERVINRAAPTITTDDLGQYRIHSLPPGEYIISAMASALGPVGNRLTDAEVDAILAGQAPSTPNPAARIGLPNTPSAPTYFPNVVSMADAQALTVGVAEDRAGLDITLTEAPPVRIEGTVTTGDGSPLPQVIVTLAAASGGGAVSPNSALRPEADGRFSMSIRLPNTYTVSARTLGAPQLFAMTSVEVRDTDVLGVSLVLRMPMAVSGRFAAQGTSPAPALTSVRLSMLPLSPVAGPATTPTVSTTAADGTFRITGLLPGRYHFSGAPFFGASTASVQWGVESITLDGTDITDRAFEVSGERPPKEVVVTLTDRWQQISGRLLDDQNRGVSDFTVMAFPADETLWLWQTRRIVTATPGTDGAYTLGGPGPAMLPAGEYYLAVVTDVSRDEQFDPAFLKTLIPAALRVTLEPGGRVNTDVRVK